MTGFQRGGGLREERAPGPFVTCRKGCEGSVIRREYGYARRAAVSEGDDDEETWDAGVRIDGDLSVYLEVELRTPAFIRSGRRLDFRELRIEFDAQEPWYGVQSLREAVEAELRDATESLRREAVSVGQAVADAVADMLGVR